MKSASALQRFLQPLQTIERHTHRFPPLVRVLEHDPDPDAFISQTRSSVAHAIVQHVGMQNVGIIWGSMFRLTFKKKFRVRVRFKFKVQTVTARGHWASGKSVTVSHHDLS